MFTLRIFLMDLIALVRGGDGISVLLPDATQGEERLTDGSLLDRHFPVVLFDTSEEEAGDWEQVREELTLRGRRAGRIWRLDREEIVISGQGRGPLELVQDGAVGGEIPIPETADDLFWVPRMVDIAGAGFSEIDPQCLATPPSPKVIARMNLTTGSLRTVQFAKFTRRGEALVGRIAPFQFRTGGQGDQGTPPRAIADLLVAEIPIEGNAVTVRAVKFGEDREREVRLTPRGRTNPVVNMLLANLSPLTPEDRRNGALRGPHFAYYYTLAQNPLPRAQRRIPHRVLGNDFPPRFGIEGSAPRFIDQIARKTIGGINRQICTFAFF